MSIGGSDFDLRPWAYNEQPNNDQLLSNFTSLDPRDLQKVEQLKHLKKVAQLQELKIMAVAWSAPPWMKTNNRWTGFGQLRSQYYQTWADYHLKWVHHEQQGELSKTIFMLINVPHSFRRFLELMQAINMPVWAISTGNEPLNGVVGFFFVHFMSMGWTPWQQVSSGRHLYLQVIRISE